jgi:hypothetical protein
MNKTFLGLFGLLASFMVSAQSFEQNTINIVVVENEEQTYGNSMVVNSLVNHDNYGPNEHYLAVTCTNGQKTFSTQPIFTGIHSDFVLNEGSIHLVVAKYGVNDVSKNIKDMPETTCQTIEPSQKVVWQKNIDVPASDLWKTKEFIVGEHSKILVKLSNLPSDPRMPE